MAFEYAVRHSPSMPGTGRTADDDGLAPRAPGLRQALVRFFRSKIQGSDEAEDLAQDVFLRIVQRNDDEPVEHLGGYVFRTAASVLADRARRREARSADKHVEFDPEWHGDTDFAPDRLLEGKQELQKAMAGLLSLPERTRTIFILFRLEGIPQRDIARQLGISISTVEKHMIRAMQHLTSIMGKRP